MRKEKNLIEITEDVRIGNGIILEKGDKIEVINERVEGINKWGNSPRLIPSSTIAKLWKGGGDTMEEIFARGLYEVEKGLVDYAMSNKIDYVSFGGKSDSIDEIGAALNRALKTSRESKEDILSTYNIRY